MHDTDHDRGYHLTHRTRLRPRADRNGDRSERRRQRNGYLKMCATAADGIRKAGAFGEPEQWRFDWGHRYARDEWLELVPTSGGHSQIPPARLEQLLAAIGAAIDAVGGGFTMHFTTVAVTATRTGAS